MSDLFFPKIFRYLSFGTASFTFRFIGINKKYLLFVTLQRIFLPFCFSLSFFRRCFNNSSCRLSWLILSSTALKNSAILVCSFKFGSRNLVFLTVANDKFLIVVPVSSFSNLEISTGLCKM